MGKWNSYPLRTSLVLAMFSLILFYSEVNTLEDICPLRATTSSCCSSSSSSTNSKSSSSSSSDLARFLCCLFSGCDFRDYFGGVSAYVLIISPVTDGQRPTIRLLLVCISVHNDYGSQLPATRFPSSSHTCLVPPELPTVMKILGESLPSYSILHILP